MLEVQPVMLTQFSDADREWLRQAAAYSGPRRLDELDDDFLRQLSQEQGVDFATAYLFHAICASAEKGPFVRRMAGMLADAAPPMGRKMDAAFVVVPGAFYREHPETGADGRSLCSMAAALGCRTHVIPTHSMGSAAANGRILCDWLRNQGERDIILCSLSKGGADVKMALAEPGSREAFQNVLAWLNVGGITSGSPQVSWLLARRWLASLYRALFWCRGQDFAFVREMRRGAGSAFNFEVSPPAHLRVIHVLGFLLTHHLQSRRTRRWHRRLSRYGPNDGSTILADSCHLPGLILPVWGADHYFAPVVRPEVLLQALLRYLGEELNLLRAQEVIVFAPALDKDLIEYFRWLTTLPRSEYEAPAR